MNEAADLVIEGFRVQFDTNPTFGIVTTLVVFFVIGLFFVRIFKAVATIFHPKTSHRIPSRAETGYGTQAPKFAGASASPEYSLNQVVFRPTWGVQLLTAFCAVMLGYLAFVNPDFRIIDGNKRAFEVLYVGGAFLMGLSALLYIFLYEARIDGDIMHIRHWSLQMREYDLSKLTWLRNGGNALWQAGFEDGSTVKIMNQVKGASELHHHLLARLKYNNLRDPSSGLVS